MDDPVLLIQIPLVSFAITFLIMPQLIRKLTESGHLVEDKYKKHKTMVPTMGGIAIILGVLGSLVLTEFFVENVSSLLIFYFVVFNFGIFGLLDDLVNLRRGIKLVIPFFIALPIGLLNTDTTLDLLFMSIQVRSWYPYIIAPLYVMVVANLVNMHSGFNGLSGGTSTILLSAVALKAYIVYGANSLYFVFPVLGALLAFMNYNFYPSRIFLGDVGSLSVGAAIGGLIIMNNMEMFGLIILMPHIADFLLFVYAMSTGKKFKKYGTLRPDGTIKPPYPYKLKFLLPYYYRMNELTATIVLYSITGFCCLIALLIT